MFLDKSDMLHVALVHCFRHIINAGINKSRYIIIVMCLPVYKKAACPGKLRQAAKRCGDKNLEQAGADGIFAKKCRSKANFAPAWTVLPKIRHSKLRK